MRHPIQIEADQEIGELLDLLMRANVPGVTAPGRTRGPEKLARNKPPNHRDEA
jgi:hypothetical protein